MDETRIDPAAVAALYVRHADELRRFVAGVLRDAALAEDVLQATFVKAVEQGHTVQPDALKAWLFRVAYHEALALRRRGAVERRATEKLTTGAVGRGWAEATAASEAPAAQVVRFEEVERVRAALEGLVPEQRQVVRMRIYEGRKFAEIAAELQLPLGTVLTRMQSALKHLRRAIEES